MFLGWFAICLAVGLWIGSHAYRRQSLALALLALALVIAAPAGLLILAWINT
jgi:hypothetical protein